MNEAAATTAAAQRRICCRRRRRVVGMRLLVRLFSHFSFISSHKHTIETTDTDRRKKTRWRDAIFSSLQSNKNIYTYI